jgi:hypothetical protein
MSLSLPVFVGTVSNRVLFSLPLPFTSEESEVRHFAGSSLAEILGADPFIELRWVNLMPA